MRRIAQSLTLLALVALVATACGDDSSSSDGSNDSAANSDAQSSESQGESGPSSEDVEGWQTQLNAVGCYVGPVDGAIGSQTEAAIEAFQAAKGLEVDGVVGSQTAGALDDAVAAGETVCAARGDGDSGEGAGDRAAATLESASYGPIEFLIGSCASSGESDIELQGQVDNLTLQVDAAEADRTEATGIGTLSVDGGTEQDGITLNGVVEGVTVGDAGNFTVTGVFGPPNFIDEEFTLTGSCA
jgi:peptidoglycan hydrolase-like protein with peptidoglycan-binding domain